MEIKQWRDKYASLAFKTKIGASVIAIFLALLIAAIVLGSIAEQAAKPLAAVNKVISWIWGDSNEQIDQTLQDQLEQCLRAGLVTSADAALGEIPAGINPDKAYGWLLYSLAHETPSSTTPRSSSARPSIEPTTSTPSRRSPRSRETEGSAEGLTFADFSRRWNLALNPNNDASSSAVAEDDAAAATPPELAEIDPDTDYDPYIASAAAATVRAIDTQVVTADDQAKGPYLSAVTARCFTNDEDVTHE